MHLVSPEPGIFSLLSIGENKIKGTKHKNARDKSTCEPFQLHLCLLSVWDVGKGGGDEGGKKFNRD